MEDGPKVYCTRGKWRAIQVARSHLPIACFSFFQLFAELYTSITPLIVSYHLQQLISREICSILQYNYKRSALKKMCTSKRIDCRNCKFFIGN